MKLIEVMASALIVMIIMIIATAFAWTHNAYGKVLSHKDVLEICKEHKYDNCKLVKAISWVETRNKPKRFNPEKTGSYGLMQIQCSTARMLDFNDKCSKLYDEKINIRIGIKYLKWLTKRHRIDNIKSLIAAWNSGTPIVCSKWNKGKCYPGEYINEHYVWNVMRHYEYLGGDLKWQPQKLQLSNLNPTPQLGTTSITLQKKSHHIHRIMMSSKSSLQIESKNMSMEKNSPFIIDF